jgi:hypothetical protein
MITWSPVAEPFCRYARRRRAARRWMLADAYCHADDPTSRHLADRLAEPWAGVLAVTVREAQAGDDEALAALCVLAPDMIFQSTTDVGAERGG